MSVSKVAKLVITGDEAQTETYIWKIKNFQLVHVTPELQEQQKFTMQVGGNDGGLQSTWDVGLISCNSYSSGYRISAKLKGLKLAGRMMDKVHVHTRLLVQVVTVGNLVHCEAENIQLVRLGGTIPTGSMYEVKTSSWMDILDPGTNALTIKIQLTVLEASRKCEVQYVLNNFRLKTEGVAEKNAAMLMNWAPDTRIVCRDGKVLECHQGILLDGSAGFEQELKSGLYEATSGVINVSDVDLSPTWKDEDVIVDLTYAAGKYKITQLLEFLDATLGEAVSADPNDTGDQGTISSPTVLELFDLCAKLELKEAQKELRLKMKKMLDTAKTGADIVSMFQRVNLTSEQKQLLIPIIPRSMF